GEPGVTERRVPVEALGTEMEAAGEIVGAPRRVHPRHLRMTAHKPARGDRLHVDDVVVPRWHVAAAAEEPGQERGVERRVDPDQGPVARQVAHLGGDLERGGCERLPLAEPEPLVVPAHPQSIRVGVRQVDAYRPDVLLVVDDQRQLPDLMPVRVESGRFAVDEYDAHSAHLQAWHSRTAIWRPISSTTSTSGWSCVQ